MKPAAIAALVALSLPLAACSSVFGGRDHVSASLVSLAREVKPGGTWVLEVAEDGTVVGAEAGIDLGQVPAACMDAADRSAPGGMASEASKLVVEGKPYYQVVKQIRDRKVQVILHPDGKVAGMEDPLGPAQWPEAVVAAARRAVPPGEVVAVERVSGPEAAAGEDFHVKIAVEGEVQRVSVSKDGKVIKVVRKMRAEMKVPR